MSLRSQRILEAHQLAPHRIRTFKLSNDPKFAERLKDIVGVYVDPPAHAVVLSVDEKSQARTADEAGPRRHHDYKRHGTTTLFAALNILDGTVIGHNMKRHRHQEFVRFLNTIEAQVPKRKAIHAIIDNGHAGVAVDGAVAQQEDYGTIEAWRQRPIEGEHPYVYLDGIVLKHSWADEVRLIAVQAA